MSAPVINTCGPILWDVRGRDMHFRVRKHGRFTFPHFHTCSVQLTFHYNRDPLSVAILICFDFDIHTHNCTCDEIEYILTRFVYVT